MNEKETAEIRAGCTRFLSHHYPQTPHEILNELAAFTAPDLDSDMYGTGELIETFEAEIAELLGKPAAVFMPSGTMAQQIALRIWAERSGNYNVAFHPTCHLEIHEQDAYRRLHGLNGVLVGNRHQLMTLDDLKSVSLSLGSLLLELPQRPIGGVLPNWDGLGEMVEWARGRGIKLHMDGARLWECKSFYGREYAEIADLFDTVYVSFYKVLNGIAGAVLAGPEDVIAESKVWQRRHGGNLVRMYPLVLAAKKGLEENLPRMGEYHAKAIEVAEVLAAIPEIEVTPNPPHIPMMHIFIHGEQERLWQAMLEIAKEEKVWLLKHLNPCQIPAYSMSEIAIGNATLDLSAEEITALFKDLLRRANHK